MAKCLAVNTKECLPPPSPAKTRGFIPPEIPVPKGKQSTGILPARQLFEFSAVFDHDGCRCCPLGGASHRLHLSDHVHPLRNAPENHVPPIQEVRLHGANEELNNETHGRRKTARHKKKTKRKWHTSGPSEHYIDRMSHAGLNGVRPPPRFRSVDPTDVVSNDRAVPLPLNKSNTEPLGKGGSGRAGLSMADDIQFMVPHPHSNRGD